MTEKGSPQPPIRQVGQAVDNGLAVLEEVGSRAGYILSKFSYVVGILSVYVLLSLLTCIWLTVELGTFKGLASIISYEVATGGSPAPFIRDIEPRFPFLWAWLLVLHAISWLLVPMLIASAVDATYRILEKQRVESYSKLREYLREECESDGVTGDEALEKCIDRKVKEFRKLMKGLGEK